MSITVVSDDWPKLAAKLKEADKKVAARLRKGLRAVAKDIGDIVQKEGAGAMPSRGGLRAYLLADSKPQVSLAASGVYLKLQGSGHKGMQLGVMNQGIVRHPVFGRFNRSTGNSNPWAITKVTPNAWTDSFKRASKAGEGVLLAEMQKIAEELQ